MYLFLLSRISLPPLTPHVAEGKRKERWKDWGFNPPFIFSPRLKPPFSPHLPPKKVSERFGLLDLISKLFSVYPLFLFFFLGGFAHHHLFFLCLFCPLSFVVFAFSMGSITAGKKKEEMGRLICVSVWAAELFCGIFFILPFCWEFIGVRLGGKRGGEKMRGFFLGILFPAGFIFLRVPPFHSHS
jgi:hypothetical protein